MTYFEPRDVVKENLIHFHMFDLFAAAAALAQTLLFVLPRVALDSGELLQHNKACFMSLQHNTR